MKRSERFAILLFLAGLIPLYVQAQWSSDRNENTMVFNAEEDQREPAVITDNKGGIIISWRDFRLHSGIADEQLNYTAMKRTLTFLFKISQKEMIKKVIGRAKWLQQIKNF